MEKRVVVNEVSKLDPRGLSPDMPPFNARHPIAFAVLSLTDSMFEGAREQEKFSPAMREAARNALQELEPFERPVTEQVLREWVAPIPLVVRNEKTPEALAGWFSGLLMAVERMPCGAFTRRSQRDAIQTFQFFPSVADICALLQPTVTEIRDRMRALRQIATEETP